jgi:serine/threonine protein kinase
VLFYNIHLAGMLARIQSILGPWPEWMLENGSKVSDYFSKENLIFFEEDGLYHILIPKKTSLRNRIRTDDAPFLSFLGGLLEVDPDRRPSAQQALMHPFLQ